MAHALYVVPVGTVAEGILTALCCGVEETWGTHCVLAPALPEPSYAYCEHRKQYLSSSILAQLKRLDLPEANRILGVVDQDLYVPELNFVFGQAIMGGGEALIALPRLRQSFYGLPEEPELFQQRMLKEAIHELGHACGLGHCHNRRCVMYFSNSLSDTDYKEHQFCANCRSRWEGQQRQLTRASS